MKFLSVTTALGLLLSTHSLFAQDKPGEGVTVRPVVQPVLEEIFQARIIDRALKDKTRTREGERGPRVRRKRAPQPKPRQDHESAETRGPRSFKVVNAITREVLGDGIGARETVELLDGMRSVVDAHIFVREPGTDEWRALTLREQRKIWGLRGR